MALHFFAHPLQKEVLTMAEKIKRTQTIEASPTAEVKIDNLTLAKLIEYLMEKDWTSAEIIELINYITK